MELIRLLDEKVKSLDEETTEKQRMFNNESPFEEITAQVLVGDSVFSPYDLISRTLHQLARDGNHTLLALALERLGDQAEKRVNKLDEDGLAPLHYAARYSHTDTVRTLLQRNAYVNIRGVDGLTPLHFAARYRRSIKKRQKKKSRVSREEFRNESDFFLKIPEQNVQVHEDETEEEKEENNVEETAEVVEEEQDGEGREDEESEQISAPVVVDDTSSNSPFEEETESVVKVLVENGALLNARDIYDLTPLHYAAMRGNDVVARDLLSYPDIDIEARDKQLMTPLFMAANYGYEDICRQLIDQNADLTALDEGFHTPLHNAAAEGFLGLVELLLSSAMKKSGEVGLEKLLSARNVERQTALHVAVTNGNKETTKKLLEHGADVNAKRDTLATPLHAGAVVGDPELLSILLEYGAKIDAVDVNQQTALHKAAANNQKSAIFYLLEKGAKIERRDRDSFTPLLLAASAGHPDAVEALLEKGASVEAVDKDDKTAVFWCSEQGHEKTLKVLLEDCACQELIDFSDRYDNSPLHEAARKGYVKVLRTLLDAGSQIDNKNEDEETALHIAAEQGRLKAVRELIQRYRFLINDENEDGNTALHLASLTGKEDVVEELLEAGADVEARNTSLWTPLDCASAKGHVNVCKLLIDYDSPLDPIDKTKTTPLQLAAREGHVDVTSLLLEKGASVSVCDATGRNALELAIASGRRDVALVIVRSSQWLDALRNTRKDPRKSYRRITPFRMLIRNFPDVAEIVLDRCTTTNGKDVEDRSFGIKFNYEFVDDTYMFEDKDESDSNLLKEGYTNSLPYDEDGNLLYDAIPYTDDAQELKKNHPLMLMVKYKRSRLLGHPISVSLVKHKWQSYGRKLYYSNLAFYLVFLISLTGYVTNAVDWNYVHNIQMERNETDLGKSCQVIQESLNLEESIFVEIGKWVVVGTAALNILREVFQFYQRRMNYFGLENLLEWICYICALLLVWDWSGDSECFIRENWQWQVGAVSIFLAWMNLVLFIRKFPYFGIYVVMFTDIFNTFCKFFVVFFLFIVGFGLSFYMIFRNQIPFDAVGSSMLKTTVMMIGEFEFDSIFNSDSDVPFEAVSYVLFVVFLILMPILIMNLLVGLAVDDIKAVQEHAILKRFAMQAELVMGVEIVIPETLRRHFAKLHKITYPNMEKYSCSRILKDFRLLDRYDYANADDSISDKENLENRLTDLSNQVKELRQQNMKLHSLLTALVSFSQNKRPGNETPSMGHLTPN